MSNGIPLLPECSLQGTVLERMFPMGLDLCLDISLLKPFLWVEALKVALTVRIQ